MIYVYKCLIICLRRSQARIGERLLISRDISGTLYLLVDLEIKLNKFHTPQAYGHEI